MEPKKSQIIYNRMGCYDFCHPKNKSESYIIKFANGKTAIFEYDEDYSPDVSLDEMSMPIDLIEELRDHESKHFIFSSSYDHFGEKTHEQKIALCEEWEKESRKDDCLAWAKIHSDKVEKLLKESERLQNISKSLIQEYEETHGA
jgi:UDP-glucose 4-epimerase